MWFNWVAQPPVFGRISCPIMNKHTYFHRDTQRMMRGPLPLHLMRDSKSATSAGLVSKRASWQCCTYDGTCELYVLTKKRFLCRLPYVDNMFMSLALPMPTLQVPPHLVIVSFHSMSFLSASVRCKHLFKMG